jgi:hypothetical protein
MLEELKLAAFGTDLSFSTLEPGGLRRIFMA